jgi:hypothetical protein
MRIFRIKGICLLFKFRRIYKIKEVIKVKVKENKYLISLIRIRTKIGLILIVR